jgi:tetratricopeptide (TPR) repeat protein
MIKAYDLARKYYLQAIELNEKSDRPHVLLAREEYKTMADSYFQENRFKESQEWLQKALDTLREGENGLDVRFALARTYEGLERFEDAIAVYQALLEMSPNNELYLHFLGSAWNKVGEHDKAIDCLQQAIALSPDNPAICQTLGIIYHNLEQYDKAVHLLQKAITLEPENTDRSNGYLCLGAMYLESTSVERRRTAIQYLHKAVDMGNERAEELLRRIQVIIH